LAKGMNNFFARVMPEGPVVRNNVCSPSQYGGRKEGREGGREGHDLRRRLQLVNQLLVVFIGM